MNDIPDEVTFLPWDCELTNDTLHVMRVQYLEGDLEYGTRTGDNEFTFYASPARVDLNKQKLVVTVFSQEKSAVFDLSFFDTFGFRVLDECGLTEIWNEYDKKRAVGLGGARLFRISGHSWSKESVLSFLPSPYSWMISTDWDCVEVISMNEPQIERIDEVTGVKGPVPDDPIDSFFNPPTKH
jgi:hypothetical protein